MASNYAKQPRGGVKLRSTKIRLPKDNPLGKTRTKPGFLGAPTSIKPKSYAKAALNSDPFAYTNVGFGNTGLTGES